MKEYNCLSLINESLLFFFKSETKKLQVVASGQKEEMFLNQSSASSSTIVSPGPSPRLKLYETARTTSTQDHTALASSASGKRASAAHVPAPVRFHGVIVPEKPATPVPVLPPTGSVADAQYFKFVAQWRDNHQTSNPDFDKFLARQRRPKKPGAAGAGGSRMVINQVDDAQQREMVFGKEPFVPVPTQQSMEKVFASDLRAHVRMSSLRVAFCRRGGKFQDDGFEPIAHQSGFSSHVDGTYHRELVEKNRIRQVSSASTTRSSAAVPPMQGGGHGSLHLCADSKGEANPQLLSSSAWSSRQPSAKSTRHARPCTAATASSTGSGGALIPPHAQAFLLTEVGSPQTLVSEPPPQLQQASPAGGAKFVLPQPWTCVIAHFEVQDVVQGKITPGKEKQLHPAPHLVETYKQLLFFMCVSNDDFGRMVDYRKQPVEKIAEEVQRSVSSQVWTKKDEGVAGALLHEAFNRFLDVSLKDFYTSAAAEVQRWISDRSRLYEMKFRAMHVEESTIVSLESMLLRTKTTIATALKTSLSEERNRTKHNFVELFSKAIRKNFSQLSSTAAQLMTEVEVCFFSENPLSFEVLSEIVDAIPTEGLFASDVMSIVYSLFSGLCVPEMVWLTRIRDRMKFTISSRTMIDLPKELTNLAWVFRLEAAEIGKSLIQWLCSAKLFAAISATSSNREGSQATTQEQLLHFLSQIPQRRLIYALLPEIPMEETAEKLFSDKRSRAAAVQALRGVVAAPVIDLLVK